MSVLITSDRKMLDLIQLAKTVAQSKATVLIQGDSGTGKELMAELIHRSSSRGQRAFVAINCAAIPDALLESELFGYEKGAFTGAHSSRPGKFEQASGGTLLLDEISEMDIRLQAKLLRVIQEGVVDRVGGRRPIPVDVRIIATTNRKLVDCVKEGSFREDLFFRLNVVTLTLPKLKDRLGDVRLLADHFLRQYAAKNKKVLTGISPEAFAQLESHDWPGNVRELENVMERAIITSRDNLIQSQDISIQRVSGPIQIEEPVSPTIHQFAPDGSRMQWIPGTTLEDIERDVILNALGYHQGNRTHTAKALGISIRTLRNKLADYRRLGIQV